MSDPRKPIDNGRSWKAEFLPGSPGEKAIESLGLRPDHLRHDLVAFDEQIESLTAEITRLREELAFANDQRRMMADAAMKLDAELAAWKAVAEKRHDILFDLAWAANVSDDRDSYCPGCDTFKGKEHGGGCVIARAIAQSECAATDAIVKEPTP